MTTTGIKPGDVVQVSERRGEQELLYNGLVVSLSMDDKLAGTHGEPAIKACFVVPIVEDRYIYDGVVAFSNVVHVSHRDFIEGRAGLAYGEVGRLILLGHD